MPEKNYPTEGFSEVFEEFEEAREKIKQFKNLKLDKWVEKETDRYMKNKNPDLVLRLTYLNAKIPADNPGKRIDYLSNLIGLEKIVPVKLRGFIKEGGTKDQFLIELEKLFLELY
ncbi:MAG: hypothetical protein PVJ67_02775 [Candidatus Pacearchaeota archaeon]|jgi:hypothetical protein